MSDKKKIKIKIKKKFHIYIPYIDPFLTFLFVINAVINYECDITPTRPFYYLINSFNYNDLLNVFSLVSAKNRAPYLIK